jgi:hypothetical protein
MKLTAIILSLFAVVMTVNASAATSEMEQHEVLFNGTNGGLQVGGGQSGGSTPLTLGATFGYNYQFMPGVMIGISPSIQYYNNASGTSVNDTRISFLAGPTVNFPFTDNFENAFYLFGGVGMVYDSNPTLVSPSVSQTNFQFGFELGKRFQLFEHLVYRPSVGFTKETGTNAPNGIFTINVLSFAAAF